MALDKERIKQLNAEGRTTTEIAAVLNAKFGTVYAAQVAMGLTVNKETRRHPRKKAVSEEKSVIPVKEDMPVVSENIIPRPARVQLYEKLSLLDHAMQERNVLQQRIFALNKVIELLDSMPVDITVNVKRDAEQVHRIQ